MTEERLAEIKAEYENARGVEYVRLKFGKISGVSTVTDSQASEDMFDLIAEVERMSHENARLQALADFEVRCTIKANQEIARLRKALEGITAHRVNHFITKDAMVTSMFETAKGALQNGTD